MKASVPLFLLVAATAAVFYLVWMNRASEKIVTAVIPIAVAALVGVSMAILVFGGEPPLKAKFPAAFLFRLSDKAPWTPPPRPLLNSLFQVPELQKEHPDLMADTNQGATLYHHLLQKAIVDILAQHYRQNWEAEITRFETGGMIQIQSGPAADASEPSMKLSFEQIKALLKGNRFAESPYMRPELTLPRGTSLSVSVPSSEGTRPEEGHILLKNDFVRLSIRTQYSFWMRSLGSYRLILGYSLDQDREFATAQYLVTIQADFNRLRSGHPKMFKYKRWVQQIITELQTELDEQAIWATTKDRYTFLKQLEQFSGVKEPERPLTLSAPEYH